MAHGGSNSLIDKIRVYSIPLILGVIVAVIWANVHWESYYNFIHLKVVGTLDIHFLVNDIFMVFFFAVAAIEITMSFLPGGSLNPMKKAINPLFATIGGVAGPIAVFFILNALIGGPEFARGWGIPTATDIALAWLLARIIFGVGHPAVSFLLLLAIVDDAIGLGIIAIFYPNPDLPAQPIWLLSTLAGMISVYIMRKMDVRSFVPYLIVGGLLSWFGLYNAGLHPALSLVVIIPFLPHVRKQSNSEGSCAIPSGDKSGQDSLLSCETSGKDSLLTCETSGKDSLLTCGTSGKDQDSLLDCEPQDHGHEYRLGHSTLLDCEIRFKPFVDFGLFFFGLCNAGVQFASISAVTWIVLFSLIFGKTIGVYGFGRLAEVLGFPLPDGMTRGHLATAGLIAGLGLTVALFVAGVAFKDPSIQGAAKMGALFSAVVFILAPVVSRMLGVKRKDIY